MDNKRMNNSAPLPKLKIALRRLECPMANCGWGSVKKEQCPEHKVEFEEKAIAYYAESVHALLEEIEKRVESIKNYGEGCNCLRGGDCVECNRNIKINSIIKQIQEARK